MSLTSQSVFHGEQAKIGALLINKGKLQQNQLERALSHLASVPQSLGEILISLGFISEEDLCEALAEQLGLTVYTPLPHDEFLPLAISNLFHREHPFALIKRGEKHILTLNNPKDSDILAAAEILLNVFFEIQITTETGIKKIVDLHYGLGLDEIETISVDESDIDKLKDMASEAPVIKYVNNLIDTALNRRASDIHMEPFEEGLLIRFRIDGILHDYEIPPLPMQAAIISRTKLLASLDIAERRLPQDGKISMRIAGKELDLRVSTLPTIHGEGVVMRILEKGTIILEMSSLGMSSQVENEFRKLITIPNGIILVTGPTGSGKTTTLYCALNKINSSANKIITIEDPVEYQLQGINQIQARPDIGLTFSQGLRSIVRQDPDVIMIGEIRDFDTAEIAVQSSLTGHLVFSTLHTNDAVSAIIRMADIGIERFLISSSLRGVMAQRLVRSICQTCTIKRGMASDFIKLKPGEEDFDFFKGKGCDTCSNTGYQGRTGLYEFLVVTDALSRGISRGADLIELRATAEAGGFQTMFADGLDKVRKGLTSFAEVVRVCRGVEDGLV